MRSKTLLLALLVLVGPPSVRAEAQMSRWTEATPVAPSALRYITRKIGDKPDRWAKASRWANPTAACPDREPQKLSKL